MTAALTNKPSTNSQALTFISFSGYCEEKVILLTMPKYLR